jgi:RHS repeat-associated protein
MGGKPHVPSSDQTWASADARRRHTRRRRILAVAASSTVLAQVIGLGIPAVSAATNSGTVSKSASPGAVVAKAAPIDMRTTAAGASGFADPSIGGAPIFLPYTPPASKSEVASARTRSTRTLANPDGTFTLEESAGAINFKDAAGNWQPINLALVADAKDGYSYRVAADSETIRFGNANGALVSLASGSHKVSLGVAGYGNGALGTGVSRNAVSFAGVAGQATMWAQPLDVGVEFGATWDKAGGLPQAVYALDPGDLKPALDKDGQTVQLVDASGATVGWIEPPIMREGGTDGPPILGKVTVALAPTVAGGYSLTYSVDPTWFADPGRVFPIVLDPTWCFGAGASGCTHNNASGNFDSFVFSATPDSYEVGWTTMRVGYDVRSDDGDVYSTMRGLLYFYPATLPDGAVIYDTDLQAHICCEYGGSSGETINAYRLTKLLTSHYTWTKFSGAYTTVDGASATVPASGYMHWDVDGIVHSWYTRRAPDFKQPYGFLLRMASEGSSHGEVEFHRYTNGTSAYQPLLTVSYSLPKVGLDFDPRLGRAYAPSSMVANVPTKIPVIVQNKTGSDATVSYCRASDTDCWKVGYRWFDAKNNLVGGGTAAATTDLVADVPVGGQSPAPFPVSVTPPATTGQYTLRLDLVHYYGSSGTYAWASDYASPSLYYSRNKKLLTSDYTRWTGSSAIERDEFSVTVVGGPGGGDTKRIDTGMGGSLGIDLFSRNVDYAGDTGLGFADRNPIALTYGYNKADSVLCQGYVGILDACGWYTNFDERIVGGANRTGYDYAFVGANGVTTTLDTDPDGQIAGGASAVINRERVTILDENGGWDGSDSNSSPDVPAVLASGQGFSAFAGQYVAKAASNASAGVFEPDVIDLNNYHYARFAMRTTSAASAGICFKIHNLSNSTITDDWYCYTTGTSWTTTFDQQNLGLQAGLPLAGNWNYYSRDLYSDVRNDANFGASTDDFQVIAIQVQSSSASNTGSTYVDAFRLEAVETSILDETNLSTWTNGQGYTSATSDAFIGSSSIKVAPTSGADLTKAYPNCLTGTCWSSSAGGLWSYAFGDWYWKKTGGNSAAIVFYVHNQRSGGPCYTSDCALIYYAGATPSLSFTDAAHPVSASAALRVSGTIPTTWTLVRRNLLEDARQAFGMFNDAGDGSGDDVRMTGYSVVAVDGTYLQLDRFSYGSLPDAGSEDPTRLTGQQSHPSAAGDSAFTFDFSADFGDGSRHYFNRDGLLERIRSRDGQETNLDWSYSLTGAGPSAYTLTAVRAAGDGTTAGALTYLRRFSVTAGNDGTLNTLRFDEDLGTTGSDVSNRAAVFELTASTAGSQTGSSTTASGTGARAWLGSTFYAVPGTTVTIAGTISGNADRWIGLKCPDTGGQDEYVRPASTGPWTFTVPGTGENGCRAYLSTAASSATITTWSVAYKNAGDLMNVVPARDPIASGATGSFCGARPNGCQAFSYVSGSPHKLQFVGDPRWDGSPSGSSDYRYEVVYTSADQISVTDRSHASAALLKILTFNDSRDATLLYNRPFWQDADAAATGSALASDLGPDGRLLSEYAPRACSPSDCSSLPATGSQASYKTTDFEFDGIGHVNSTKTYRCPTATDAVGGCTGGLLATMTRQGSNAAAKVDNYSDPLAAAQTAWTENADQVFASLRDSGGTNADLYRTEYLYDGSGQASETFEAHQLDTSNYVDTINADAPYAEWRMNETSGATLIDGSGHGHTGSYPVSPILGQAGALIRDPSNKAPDFNGSTNYAQVLAGAMGTVSGTYSIEAWVRPDTTSGTMGIVGSRNATGGMSLDLVGGTKVHGVIGDGTNQITTTADADFTYTAGSWYYIVYVVTPNSYTVYADGRVIGGGYFSTSTPVLTNSSHNFYIGQYGGGASQYFWNGEIDEVAVYNSVLTASDVFAHYRAGRAIATVDTVATRDAYGHLTEAAARFAVNGGFEQGANGWDLGSGASVVTSGGANSGGVYVQLGTTATTQVMQLVPGQTFRLQYSTKTSSGNAHAKLEYWNVTALPSPAWSTVGSLDVDHAETTWTAHAFDVSLPFNTDGRVRLSLSENGGGTGGVDDVAVVTNWASTSYNLTPGVQFGLPTDANSLNACATGSCALPTIASHLDYSDASPSPLHPAIFPETATANYQASGPHNSDTNVASTKDYDAWGRTVATTDPDGVLSSSTFDDSANPENNQTDLLATTDGLGLSTKMQYDAAGNTTSTIAPSGLTTASTYDLNNNVLTTTAPDGTVARSDYDNYGREIRTWANYVSGTPGGDHDLLTATSYDQFGNATRVDADCGSTSNCVTGALDAVSTTSYDLLGNVVDSTVFSGSAAAAGTDRTTSNRFEKYVVPAGNGTTWSGLTFSRATATAVQNAIAPTGSAPACPDGSGLCNTVKSFDLSDHAIASTDPYGVVTTSALDIAYRPVRVIDNSTTAADDLKNDQNITTVTRYDVLGRTVATYLPMNAGTTRSDLQSYDALGRVTTVTHKDSADATVLTEMMSYLPSGRIDSTNDGASTTHKVYDAAGQVVATIANYDAQYAGMTLDAFESGLSSDWTGASTGIFTTSAIGAGPTLDEAANGSEYTAVAPVSGRGRLHFTTAAGSGNDGVVFDLSGPTFQAGHAYKVAFDMSATSGAALHALLGDDEAGGSFGELTSGLTGDGAWHRYSFAWTPSSSISSHAHFVVRKDTAGAADVYLDNVVVWDTTATDKSIVSSQTAYDQDGRIVASVLPPGDPASSDPAAARPLVTTVAFDAAGNAVMNVVGDVSGAYASAVRSTSSVAAYYPLDATTGVVATDALGGTGLVHSGSADWGVAGAIDEARTALRLSGSNGFLSRGTAVTTKASDVGLEAWVRADTAPGDGQLHVVAANGTALDGWGIAVDSTGHAVGWTAKSSNPNSGFFTQVSNAVVTDGAWHHLLLARNAATWTLAVDGVGQTLTNNTKDPGTPGAGFSIGAMPDGTLPFAGEIDEVSVYSTNVGSVAAAHYAAGRRPATDTATALTTRTNFDGLGRPVDTWSPATVRVGSIDFPIRTHALWDRLGNQVETTENYWNGVTSGAPNDDDVKSTYAYDVLGELVGYCPANQVVTGTCVASADTNTQAWHYGFDKLGQPTTTVPPVNAGGAAALDVSKSVYDTGGRLAQTCLYISGADCGSTNSRHTDFAYDALGRTLTSKTWDRAAGSDVLKFTKTIVWNVDGTQASVSEGTDTLTFVYDNDGRPSQLKRGAAVLTAWTYTAATGTLASRTDGALTTSFLYDWAKRPTTITPPGGYVAGTIGRTYRLDGALASQSFPNGLTETLTYDAAKRPTAISMGASGSMSQTFDRGGRVTSEGRTIPGISGDAGANTQSFTFDGLSRIKGSSGLTNLESYTFDLDGNRLTRTVGGVTTTYVYDRTDELVRQTIGATQKSFSYDAFGDMTTSADAASSLTTYAYDESERLVSITPPSGSAATFTTDALGRNKTRTVGAAVDTYGYLGVTETAYETGAGTTDALLDPSGARLAIKTGSSVSFVLFDLHGSIAGLCPSTSTALTDAYRYDGWGETTLAVGTAVNPWRYRGLLDVSPNASPLYDMGSRYYSPQLGTFTQEDSVAGKAADPLSMNRFLYAEANPTTLIDPDGHDGFDPFGFIGQVASNAWDFGAGVVEGAWDTTVSTVTGAVDLAKSTVSLAVSAGGCALSDRCRDQVATAIGAGAQAFVKDPGGALSSAANAVSQGVGMVAQGIGDAVGAAVDHVSHAWATGDFHELGRITGSVAANFIPIGGVLGLAGRAARFARLGEFAEEAGGAIRGAAGVVVSKLTAATEGLSGVANRVVGAAQGAVAHARAAYDRLDDYYDFSNVTKRYPRLPPIANKAFPRGFERQELTHTFIPQRARVPNIIKNTPWNLRLQWGTTHALNDAARYRFLPAWWKRIHESEQLFGWRALLSRMRDL